MLLHNFKTPQHMSINPSNPDFLNYEELSDIFSGKPAEFINVLKMVHEDFLTNHILIMDAIEEDNVEQFKKIYHNLRGNINLFDMYILRELMNKIEGGLEDGLVKEKKISRRASYSV